MTDPQPPQSAGPNRPATAGSTTESAPVTAVRRAWLIRSAVVVAFLVVVAGVVVQQRASQRAASEEQAGAASERFAAAWAADSFVGVAFVDANDVDVTRDYHRLTDGLGEFAVTIEPQSTVVTDEQAVSTFAVEWTLAGGVVWTTEATVELARQDDEWRMRWAPTVVHPDLSATTRLVADRLQPERGDIVGADDQVLVTELPVVDVGLQPNRAEDIVNLITTLQRVLGIDGAALASRVQAAAPDAFVPVITLRRADYDVVREQIQPIAGTVFRERTQPLAPTREFARALLGTSGAVTAEIIEGSGDRYRVGDIAGVSGLQARYDEVLRGTTGIRLLVTNAPLPGDPVPDDPDAVLQLDVVFEAPAVDGGPVRTTIDPRVQEAADQALEGTTLTSSIVVVRPSTGEILAVGNGPGGGTGENLAFTGQYPPGSAFKVVSTQALLGTGLTPGEEIDCPAEITIDGRTFRNAELGVFGQVPFREDFARSCNTAFVGLSSRLGNDSLTTAGARFGLGGTWDVGMPAFTGSVPPAESAVDKAAATLGQGRVLVSPLALAMVGATVADGAWRPPVLVREPADAASAGDGAGALRAPIPAGEIDTLRLLMREAVTDGTGFAVANVPGDPVSGKTGTAEFGTDDPPRSHAWFIGFQGDLAFAVFVEGGEFGGETAAPLAASMLRALDVE